MENVETQLSRRRKNAKIISGSVDTLRSEKVERKDIKDSKRTIY